VAFRDLGQCLVANGLELGYDLGMCDADITPPSRVALNMSKSIMPQVNASENAGLWPFFHRDISTSTPGLRYVR
jgi:hypothetical protein